MDNETIGRIEPTKEIASYGNERAQPIEYTAVQVKAQVQKIQAVMDAVMKPKVHYDKPYPSAKKNTLLKAGAEKLCMTFRIACKYEILDLSTEDERRYRVITHATSIITGQFLGCGIGECSSSEEKYKWKAAICDEEFDNMPEDRRRTKYKWNSYIEKIEEVRQIRTEIADIANTILKMSKKRSNVDMVLTVTAASDIFDQDLEDGNVEMANDPKGKPLPPEPIQRRSIVSQSSNGGPCLTIMDDGTFVVENSYDIKDEVKKAGFRWNKDLKLWQSSSNDSAMALIQYADDKCKAVLNPVEKKEEQKEIPFG